MSIAMPHLNGTYPWQNQSTAQNQTPVSTAADTAPIVADPVASLTKDVPDPEVQPRAKRRTFTQKYKDNILQQAQNCTEHGTVRCAPSRTDKWGHSCGERGSTPHT